MQMRGGGQAEGEGFRRAGLRMSFAARFGFRGRVVRVEGSVCVCERESEYVFRVRAQRTHAGGPDTLSF